MEPNLLIDVYHALLALAGWTIGDVRGTLGWYVYGRNGENVIDATAATQAEAWRLATEQARAVGAAESAWSRSRQIAFWRLSRLSRARAPTQRIHLCRC